MAAASRQKVAALAKRFQTAIIGASDRLKGESRLGVETGQRLAALCALYAFVPLEGEARELATETKTKAIVEQLALLAGTFPDTFGMFNQKVANSKQDYELAGASVYFAHTVEGLRRDGRLGIVLRWLDDNASLLDKLVTALLPKEARAPKRKPASASTPMPDAEDRTRAHLAGLGYSIPDIQRLLKKQRGRG